MAKYEVTHGKTTIGDKPVEIGAVLELDAVPPSLAGKVREVADSAKVTFEVATPKRSRPAKDAE